MADKKEDPKVYKTQKMLVRAPALDDERNKLAAFVGTGKKTGMVEWLVYLHENEFHELNRPGYVTITVQNGGTINGLDDVL